MINDKYAVTAWRSHNNKLNYHVETLREFIENETKSFIEDIDTGYRLLGVFDTWEEATSYEPLGAMFSRLPVARRPFSLRTLNHKRGL